VVVTENREAWRNGNMNIQTYLADLESRIEPAVEEDLRSQWMGFLNGRMNAGIFCPRRLKQSAPRSAWPRVSVNEALGDFDLMALQQLSGCSAALSGGTGAVMNVRANYGTGILSSLFGAEIFEMDAAMDTLPTTRPLPGGVAAIERALDAGIPVLQAGYGGRCLAMGRRFVELLADYPKAARYVQIYHPDLQGPMDLCELLCGSGLFLALVDQPGLVHALLRRIVETYVLFMREWEQIAPPQDGYASHWGMLHRGRIMLRDDSAMNVSPEMFDEFIAPYDRQLLSVFAGGAIHFCGRGDHYIDRLPDIEGVYAVNLSQPECNNMARIFENTVDRGITLLGLRRDAAEAAMKQGRDLRGRVHCW
jgi:hypothetical protein